SMNSTFSSQNANKMSRKSEFSKGFSFKGPCVQRQLPHHLKTFGGSCVEGVSRVRPIRILQVSNVHLTGSDCHLAALSHSKLSVWIACSHVFSSAVTNSSTSIKATTRPKNTRDALSSCSASTAGWVTRAPCVTLS